MDAALGSMEYALHARLIIISTPVESVVKSILNAKISIELSESAKDAIKAIPFKMELVLWTALSTLLT